MDAFHSFEQKWLGTLTGKADVIFRSGPVSQSALVHAAIADEFVSSLGLKPIGYNWELLDAQASEGEPRSAVGEIITALSQDLSNPGKVWLDPKAARACAQDFLALFDASQRTIVSNRYDGLWNPIAGRAVEWGFVGFDTEAIALLLLAEK